MQCQARARFAIVLELERHNYDAIYLISIQLSTLLGASLSRVLDERETAVKYDCKVSYVAKATQSSRCTNRQSEHVEFLIMVR